MRARALREHFVAFGLRPVRAKGTHLGRKAAARQRPRLGSNRAPVAAAAAAALDVSRSVLHRARLSRKPVGIGSEKLVEIPVGSEAARVSR